MEMPNVNAGTCEGAEVTVHGHYSQSYGEARKNGTVTWDVNGSGTDVNGSGTNGSDTFFGSPRCEEG